MSADNKIGVGEEVGDFFELKQLVGVDFDYVTEMSFGLQETIQNLPKGSKVGIEYLPDFTTNKPEKYYSRLIRLCKKRDLEVVPLIDPSTIEEAAKHHTLATDGSIGARGVYMHGVMERYLLEVVNQEKIFKMISEVKLDLAILDKFNANILTSDGAQEKYKIWIKEGNCQNESIEVMDKDGGRLERFLFSGIANIDRRRYLSRKLLVRKYNVITQGRINPEWTPDFIGYWLDESNVPEEGLFEIYLWDQDKKRRAGIIHGTILDTLGDAAMIGAIGGGIMFTKTYNEQRSIDNVHGVIGYSGNRSRRGFKGIFSTKNASLEGKFVLQRFDSQKPILSELKTAL